MCCHFKCTQLKVYFKNAFFPLSSIFFDFLKKLIHLKRRETGRLCSSTSSPAASVSAWLQQPGTGFRLNPGADTQSWSSHNGSRKPVASNITMFFSQLALAGIWNKEFELGFKAGYSNFRCKRLTRLYCV